MFSRTAVMAVFATFWQFSLTVQSGIMKRMGNYKKNDCRLGFAFKLRKAIDAPAND